MAQHDIHDGFCYTHQTWVDRPRELEAHLAEVEASDEAQKEGQ